MRQAEAPRAAATPERRIIQRTRLLKQLEETDARTILLTAPAGYGKTTLARQWLSERPTAWLTATRECSDLRVLASGLADALSLYATEEPEDLRETCQVIQNPFDDLPAITRSLLGKLDERKEKVLVIDDYQVLARSDAAEQMIEGLGTNNHCVRLLICSRSIPAWASARRHIYGEIFELDRDDLAFEDYETQELLADMTDHGDLVERAAGWPVVIGLATLAGAPGAPRRETMMASLHDFLTDEVYDNVSPATQDALLDMALLPSLSPSTLYEIYGDRADEIVAEAAHTGLLAVSRHDVDLHPLAREFLFQKLHRRIPSAANRIRGAIRYAIAKGAWDEAFALVKEFRIDDQFDELISSSFSPLLANGHFDTLAKFNSHAGTALEETTAVMTLVDAEMAFRDGLLTHAQDLALSAAAELPSSHPLKSRGYVLAGTAALVGFDVKKSFRLHSQGLDYGRDGHDERDALWGQCLALIYLEDKKCHEAANLLDVGCVTPEAKLRAATARLLIRRLGDGFVGFDSALATNDLVEQASDPRARTSFGNICSYVLALRGRYDEARQVIDRSLVDAELHGLAFAMPHLHWTRAMVGLGLRQFSSADAHLRIVESSAQEIDNHHLELNARTLRARILLAQNRTEEAIAITSPEWDAIPTKAMHAEYLATRALALAVANESTHARRVMRKARDLSSVVEVQTLTATTSAIIAIDTRAAQTMAERSLRLASNLDTWDALVCGIRSAPRLLDIMSANPSNRRHLLGVLRESHDHALLKRAGLPVERQYGRAGLLSRRETEVADLLCQGLTNKEIARTLCISDATAKVHVHHILNKLGARTRTEAVALYVPNDESGAVSGSLSSSASRE